MKVSTTPPANMASSTLSRAAFLLSWRASGANIRTSLNNSADQPTSVVSTGQLGVQR